MLGQCWALIVLKLVILRHTLSTGKAVGLILVVIAALGATGLAAGVGIGAYFLGSMALAGKEGWVLLAALDGIVLIFLFVWFWGLLLEIQRSDLIDLRKMLFLPIPLPMVFVMNFMVSLVSLGLPFFVFGILGLTAGLSQAYGPHMWLTLPVAAAFYLMLAAWAYYVRGWLAIMMENKRRRRIIMTVLPLSFVVLGQLPNILTQTFGDELRELGKSQAMSGASFETVLQQANVFVPLGWMPAGVQGLAEGRLLPAALAFAGMAGLAGLGLARGYRGTVRHYRGEVKAGRAVEKKPVDRPSSAPATARHVPFLDEDTAALTWANFLTNLRHPSMRIQMVTSPLIGILLVAMYGGRMSPEALEQGWLWIPAALILWPFFTFMVSLVNLFGLDRDGFRGMILLPMPRYKLLLAKNLALFPLLGGLCLLFIVLGAFLLKLAPGVVATAISQTFQLYLTSCIVGNLISTYFPFRQSRDTMRSQRGSLLMMGVMLANMVFLGIMMIPTSFCLSLDGIVAGLWGYRGWPFGLTVSLALLALSAGGYVLALRHTGDLLLAREHKVLAALVKDRE